MLVKKMEYGFILVINNTVFDKVNNDKFIILA